MSKIIKAILLILAMINFTMGTLIYSIFKPFPLVDAIHSIVIGCFMLLLMILFEVEE